MVTLDTSFLTGSSLFLQVKGTHIKACKTSNCSQNPPLTTELAVLERLKNNQCIHNVVDALVFSLLIRS